MISLDNDNLHLITGMLAVCLVAILITLFFVKRNRESVEKSNNQLKTLFDNMQEGFARHEIICDDNGKPIDYLYLDVNNAFERITGLKKSEIINRRVLDILPRTEKDWIEKYGEVALNGETLTFNNYSRELGRFFSVSVYSPQPKQFVTIFTDVTRLKKLEQELRQEKALLQTTIHSLGDGVISTDIYGKIDIMNAVAENLTGWTLEKAKGKDFQEVFRLIDEFTKVTYLSPVQQVLETGDKIELSANKLLVRKNGETLPIEDRAAPIRDERGSILGAVLVFRDYTEKKEKQERIVYLSYHDQLTGLYNRRYFEEELTRLDTERNLPFSIAMIDVNGLKLTNDAFGHLKGDELLKRVSSTIKRECRTDDIVSRIGGDEFVVLLPRTSYVETEHIMSRIYHAINDERLDSIVMSVSIGWDTKITVDQKIIDVFIKAEESMYRRKLSETQSMRNLTIQVILKTLNEKCHQEKHHADRVSYLSKKIGQAMQFDSVTLHETEIAGLMHDIGKITIHETILNNPGRLSTQDYNEIKRHPESSYHILKSVDAYAYLSEHALYHHERWDGLGYPKGLKGEEIPLIARIIAVAEAYEAMTSNRPYKETKTPEEAITELQRYSGAQFDPAIVALCTTEILS